MIILETAPQRWISPGPEMFSDVTDGWLCRITHGWGTWPTGSGHLKGQSHCSVVPLSLFPGVASPVAFLWVSCPCLPCPTLLLSPYNSSQCKPVFHCFFVSFSVFFGFLDTCSPNGASSSCWTPVMSLPSLPVACSHLPTPCQLQTLIPSPSRLVAFSSQAQPLHPAHLLGINSNPKLCFLPLCTLAP